jgi:small subunit ribosomal protein S9
MPTAEKVIDALGTGRRKTSVARVRIRAGNGKLLINERELDDFFKIQQDRNAVVAPLEHAGVRNSVDVKILVHGGGSTGQAGACMQGIARALMKYDSDLSEKLREKHFLTRDARMKERKKPGLHGARRGTQFSKR